MLLKKIISLAFALFGLLMARAADEVEVAGKVVDANTKKPISEVVITALQASADETLVATSKGGIYTFGYLKPGTYKLIFEAAGYKKIVREKIVVSPRSTQVINIEMREKEDIEHGILFRALIDY